MKIKGKCPGCGRENDSAANVEDPKLQPSPGDLALCIECAEPAIYIENGDGTLGFRSVTLEERQNLADLPEVVETRELILKLSGFFSG